MQPDDTTFTGIEDRRASPRATRALPLRITIENPEFEGRSDNASSAGVFFFSPERLRVRVELEENGVTRVHTGHLARVQRMSEETTGYAIEFDRP